MDFQLCDKHMSTKSKHLMKLLSVSVKGMRRRGKGTDLFAWSHSGEESNIGYIFVFSLEGWTEVAL